MGFGKNLEGKTMIPYIRTFKTGLLVDWTMPSSSPRTCFSRRTTPVRRPFRTTPLSTNQYIRSHHISYRTSNLSLTRFATQLWGCLTRQKTKPLNGVRHFTSSSIIWRPIYISYGIITFSWNTFEINNARGRKKKHARSSTSLSLTQPLWQPKNKKNNPLTPLVRSHNVHSIWNKSNLQKILLPTSEKQKSLKPQHQHHTHTIFLNLAPRSLLSWNQIPNFASTKSRNVALRSRSSIAKDTRYIES